MRTILTLMLLALLPDAAAWDAVVGDVVLRCEQPDLQRLNCDYRSLTGTNANLSLHTGTGSAPPREHHPFPWPQARTAVLFLVDTSDPGRGAVIEQNIQQVAALARAARPHHKLGLARFDKDLEVLAPIGSSAEMITAAAQKLRASGMTTELYRNLQRAVELLKATEADRRFVVVFSDGQAEDAAYYHADVVNAARRGEISIMSLGFPRSVARSVALQTLRRLSDETGGLYLEANVHGTLADGFDRQILASTDSGARVAFTLPGPGPGEQAPVAVVSVQSGTRESRVEIPIRLPAPPKISAPAISPAQSAPMAGTTPMQMPMGKNNPWLWYLLPVALTILIVLALATLYLLFRQPAKALATAHAVQPMPKPFAYLISQTSQPKRFPILGPIWRIGRSRENELVLDDISISRRHAEIQRGPEGTFTILDRGARNGICVNGQPVQKRTLREGDMIEIGDMALRFTETGADEQLQEQTAIQSTRQPRTG